MVARMLPEGVAVELGAAVTGPVAGLAEHADAHLVGHLHVEARINHGVQAHGVAVHVLYGAVPGVGVAARHLGYAHEVPRVAAQGIGLAVKALARAVERPLAPSEALVLRIDALAVGGDADEHGVEVGMLGRPELERALLDGYLHGEHMLPASLDRLCGGLTREELGSQFPCGHGRAVHIGACQVEPFVYVGVELHRGGLRRRVAYGDVNLEQALRYERLYVHVAHAHLRNGEQVDVLPDAVDVVSPHRAARKDAAAYGAAVLEEPLAAHAHEYFVLLSGLYQVGNVEAEGQHQVEVLARLTPVDVHLGAARHGLEVQAHGLPAPVGGHIDRLAHPRHLHAVPLFRVRRVVAVVGTFKVSVCKIVDVPGRRYFDARLVPLALSGLRQCGGVARAVLEILWRGDGLEVPVAVEANLLAVLRLRPVHQAFARGEHMVVNGFLRHGCQCRRRRGEQKGQCKYFLFHNTTGCFHAAK